MQTTMQSRCHVLIRHLTRRRINPHTAGRPPAQRTGRVDHRSPKWEDGLNTAIDTERVLSRLTAEHRVVLLLVFGMEVSVAEAAWVINSNTRSTARLLASAEDKFDSLSEE